MYVSLDPIEQNKLILVYLLYNTMNYYFIQT